MNWIGRKIHLYNVTIGLYMLDWWERYLFSILPQCFSDSLLPWFLRRFTHTASAAGLCFPVLFAQSTKSNADRFWNPVVFSVRGHPFLLPYRSNFTYLDSRSTTFSFPVAANQTS
jgi:hypothetical protein